jgi:hypothetical protein
LKKLKLTPEVKVALITALCLVLIAFLFGNFIHKPINSLVALGPFYVLLIFILANSRNKQAGGGSAKVWNIINLLVTFLIILIYAVK